MSVSMISNYWSLGIFYIYDSSTFFQCFHCLPVSCVHKNILTFKHNKFRNIISPNFKFIVTRHSKTTTGWNIAHCHLPTLKIKVNNYRIYTDYFLLLSNFCNIPFFKYLPLGILFGITFFIFTNNTKCSTV